MSSSFTSACLSSVRGSISHAFVSCKWQPCCDGSHKKSHRTKNKSPDCLIWHILLCVFHVRPGIGIASHSFIPCTFNRQDPSLICWAGIDVGLRCRTTFLRNHLPLRSPSPPFLSFAWKSKSIIARRRHGWGEREGASHPRANLSRLLLFSQSCLSSPSSPLLVQ